MAVARLLIIHSITAALVPYSIKVEDTTKAFFSPLPTWQEGRHMLSAIEHPSVDLSVSFLSLCQMWIQPHAQRFIFYL